MRSGNLLSRFGLSLNHHHAKIAHPMATGMMTPNAMPTCFPRLRPEGFGDAAADGDAVAVVVDMPCEVAVLSVVAVLPNPVAGTIVDVSVCSKPWIPMIVCTLPGLMLKAPLEQLQDASAAQQNLLFPQGFSEPSPSLSV